MLDRRYDDLESGRVKPIDGEEAFRQLMEKNRSNSVSVPARRNMAASVCAPPGNIH